MHGAVLRASAPAGLGSQARRFSALLRNSDRLKPEDSRNLGRFLGGRHRVCPSNAKRERDVAATTYGTMTLSPSLDAARIRLRRGGEHLEALCSLEAEVCDGFLRKIERELPDRIPAEQFMSAFESLNVKPEIPDTVAVVLGEAVYNFRAALDYAV